MTSAQHATAIMRTSRGDHRFGAALSHFSVLNQKDLHDRLAAIHYAAFSRMDENGWSASVIEELFKGNGVSFYLCGQGKINAFAITRSVLDEAELLTVAVHPSLQNKGFGRQLLHYVMEDLAASGIAEMFLEVRDDNQSALALYTNLSFDKVGKRKKYYTTRTGQHIDACALRVRL